MLFIDNEKLHENYIQLIVYIACGLLELLIEPVIMHMNLHMENKFLPITISSLTRVITNTIFVSIFKMDLWGFALSRIIGSTVYISYIFSLGIFKYKLNFFNFIPKDYKSLIYGKSNVNGLNLLYLREILYQFIKLNLLNFILSRCQNVILSFIMKSTYEEKSDYSFISQNYGLITRFLLEPIIDAFYNLVNKVKLIEKKTIINPKNEEGKENNILNKNNSDEKTIIENGELFTLSNNSMVKNYSDDALFKTRKGVQNSEIKDSKKEINYEIAIKLLQLFLKIFTFIGILIIPYYLLIGTEIIGLIYGEKWQTNTIDKIGDCYSFYVIIVAVSDLIKNFGNATNDIRQMNLSYISLIINALFLLILMYILSRWDICGLIISNQLSAVFLINFNLYIVFCGKIKKLAFVFEEQSLFNDIDHFINKCFISKNSIFFSVILISIGHFVKKIFLVNYTVLIKMLAIGFIGLINACLIYIFDYKIFKDDLNFIKLHQ
jgi:hypothetical protein